MFALNNQRQISAEFKEQASQQIHELLNMVSGVDFVMLSSADGFELALASKKNLDNRGKIAAVSSSILAMVSAFIAEIHLSGCKTITLDADNGSYFNSCRSSSISFGFNCCCQQRGVNRTTVICH